MHSNLSKLDGLDVNMYVISSDEPKEQAELYGALKEKYGESLTFISDPELEMGDKFEMSNGDMFYRGYGLLDTNGEVVFKTINDHWGELLDDTVKEINKEYDNLK